MDAGRQVDTPDLEHEIQQLVARVNRKLSKHERVRHYRLIHAPLTLQSGLLTSTFKPKRALIRDTFTVEIDGLYGEDNPFQR